MPRTIVTSTDRKLGIEHETHGAGDGDWIVLIRGLGTQMIEWSSVLIDGLVDSGLRVLVFDNRDVGLSDKVEDDYRAEDMAADVIGLMDALHIERAHIFGISMGGMIAQLVAHGYSDRVLTLITVMSSSGAAGLPRAKPEVAAWMSIEADGREDYIAQDAESRVVFGSPGYPEPLEDRIAMSTKTYDRCFYPEGVARQMRAISSNRDRAEKLREIRVPALVVHGEDDALLPPEHGKDTAERIEGSTLVLVKGMGHNIPDALAPEITTTVLRFLQR